MQAKNIFALNIWHQNQTKQQSICIEKTYQRNITARLNLKVSSFFGIKIAELVGEPIIQYNDIFCPTGAALKDFRKHLIAELKSHNIALLLLRNVRKNSKLFYLLEHDAEIVSSKKAPFVKVGQFSDLNDYFMSLSAATRKSKRRNLKKINKDFKVEFEILKNDEVDPSLIDQALDLKKAQLNLHGMSSRLFADELEMERLKTILNSQDKDFDLIVSKLKCDDKIAAMEIGFLYDQTYYSFLGTIDDAFKRYSAGSVQLIHTIEWAIQNDVKLFDFLAPEDDYKFSWCGNQYMPALDLALNINPLGSLYSKLYLKKLRPMLKDLYILYKQRGSS